MSWFVAWAITAVLLLVSMLLNQQVLARNQEILDTMKKLQKAIREGSNTNLRLAQKLGEQTLKEIDETNEP